MKGVSIASTVDFLETQFGEEFILDLMVLMEMPVGAVYMTMSDYPDNTHFRVITNAAKLRGIPVTTMAKIVGVFWFSDMIALSPKWIEDSNHALAALKNYNLTFCAILSKPYPGLVAPRFDCTEIDPYKMAIHYQSASIHGDVAEGFIGSVFAHYKEVFVVERINDEPQVGFNQQFIVRSKPQKG
jgi:hypothetical protein